MTELTLTQEQSSDLKGADLPVRVRDAAGRIVGYLLPDDDSPIELTPTEVAKVANRLADDDSQFTSTSELLQRLKGLESRTGE